MSATLPLWVSLVAAAGTPVLALGGVLLGQLVARRGAREVETRWQCEETMRLLRWAADHAVSGTDAAEQLGVATLRALGVSPLLQEADQRLVSAVLVQASARARLRYSDDGGGNSWPSASSSPPAPR